MTWMNHIYAVPKNGVPYEQNDLSHMSNMSLWALSLWVVSMSTIHVLWALSYEHYPWALWALWVHVTCPFWAIHMSLVPMSPVPMSTIVHKIETLLYLWNSDLCYFRQPKTLHLHLHPTSFVLRPSYVLCPMSILRPTSIVCPTLICPSYVLR